MQTISAPIIQFDKQSAFELDDDIAIEEPLQITLQGEHFAIAMRTPSKDEELVLGLLFSERVIKSRKDISTITAKKNEIHISLQEPSLANLDKRQRAISSSCGVCSKSSLDGLALKDCELLPANTPTTSLKTLYSLPKALRLAQDAFNKTGGLHACALFQATGELTLVREDIGRHNALDKLIGARLKDDALPANDSILMLSGRVSFEMMQKAFTAGIPIVCAVGAPTSLAISVAQRFNMTLIGFLREERLNVYAGKHRITDMGNAL